MKKPYLLALFAGLSVIVPATVRADVLANYLFTGGAKTSGDGHVQTSAGDFGFGAAGTNWAFSSAQNNVFGRGNTSAASEALAVSSGSYFTFTLTLGSLGAGNALNLTSLTFDSIANAGVSVTGTANASFFVRSSLDGFTANIGNTFSQVYVNNTTPIGPVSRTVDLSAYQGVVVSSIEFRIYVFDDTTEFNRTPRVDTVVLNGSVEPMMLIPEPAASGLVAAGSLLGFALSRRRRAK